MPTEAELIRRLERVYVPMVQGIFGESPGEARTGFYSLIEKAKVKSLEKKVSHIDSQYLLSVAQTNPDVCAELNWKRREGVCDDDLRWWWDMPDLERQFIIQMDFIPSAGYFAALRDKGYSPEQAIRCVQQATPSYVEFSDMSRLPKNEDFPLPIELRRRVEQRIEQEKARDPSGAEWASYFGQFSSFNACIRHEIAKSRL